MEEAKTVVVDISSDEEEGWANRAAAGCWECTAAGRRGGGDDDECVILDGDPDKPVSIQDDNGNDKGRDDSGDLLVLGEKGQVACRDFPHSRHLCVKFPFDSTPHEWHCEQCHCYVCDSLASCVNWIAGISSVDHCHASNQGGFSKALRESKMKQKKINITALGRRVLGVPELGNFRKIMNTISFEGRKTFCSKKS